MKRLGLLLAAAAMVGCTSFRDALREEGPTVMREATRVAMHQWMQKLETPIDKANNYRTYILEAKALLDGGDLPLETLDAVAALLNEKIDNDIIRAVIQQGAEIVKRRVQPPEDGLISAELKRWVFAILDGAVAGIDDFMSQPPLPMLPPSTGLVPTHGVTTISFR